MSSVAPLPYTPLVRVRQLHPWDLTPGEAIALQMRLAPQVVLQGAPTRVRSVAAADVAFVDRPRSRQPGLARAAVVLLSYPELVVVEQRVAETPVAFPYVPGLLSFREIPALVQAFESLDASPDLLLVDGQGYAHPRRFGLACHLGLLLDIPTIGCAKSRLCGHHEPLPAALGSSVPLMDGDDLIGTVLRTRDGVAPVYVSPGHRIGLEAAAEWVLHLCRGHRIPEPLRLADRASKA